MDGSFTREEDLKSSKKPKIDHEDSKKRKMVQKTVVTVRIEANSGNKGEGPPSDFWSWRKYGQKPIKGSPYPRGYYKCSTSKGCSARKQVERCKTDASALIITYTSDHNHPVKPSLQTQSTVDCKKKKHSEDSSSLLSLPTSNLSHESAPPKSSSEENDHFFDELEELTIPSPFITDFVRSSFL